MIWLRSFPSDTTGVAIGLEDPVQAPHHLSASEFEGLHNVLLQDMGLNYASAEKKDEE